MFDEDAIVELTGLIAFQNLSSKFNSALDVPPQGFCKMPTARANSDSPAMRESAKPRPTPANKEPSAGMHNGQTIATADDRNEATAANQRRNRDGSGASPIFSFVMF